LLPLKAALGVPEIWRYDTVEDAVVVDVEASGRIDAEARAGRDVVFDLDFEADVDRLVAWVD
jgi:hypothetical protein